MLHLSFGRRGCPLLCVAWCSLLFDVSWLRFAVYCALLLIVCCLLSLPCVAVCCCVFLVVACWLLSVGGICCCWLLVCVVRCGLWSCVLFMLLRVGLAFCSVV